MRIKALLLITLFEEYEDIVVVKMILNDVEANNHINSLSIEMHGNIKYAHK